MKRFLISDLDKPVLQVTPSSNQREGDNLIMSCLTESSSGITYTWFKDGDKLSWEEEKAVVNNIQLKDMGSYKCLVGNEIEKKESDLFNLTIYCKFLVSKFQLQTLLKRGDFPLNISSVNVTKLPLIPLH